MLFFVILTDINEVPIVNL